MSPIEIRFTVDAENANPLTFMGGAVAHGDRRLLIASVTCDPPEDGRSVVTLRLVWIPATKIAYSILSPIVWLGGPIRPIVGRVVQTFDLHPLIDLADLLALAE